MFNSKKHRSRSVQSTPPPHEGMPKAPEEKPSPRTGLSFSLTHSLRFIYRYFVHFCPTYFAVNDFSAVNMSKIQIVAKFSHKESW